MVCLLRLGTKPIPTWHASCNAMPHRPLTWTVAAFMAENTGWYSHAEVATQLALSASVVITHLGALVESGFVEERMLITGPSYRFAANYRMRAFFKLWAPTLQCEQ